MCLVNMRGAVRLGVTLQPKQDCEAVNKKILYVTTLEHSLTFIGCIAELFKILLSL